MTITSGMGKARAALARPFHRDGTPTRLHPTSLWAEVDKVAGLYAAPVWAAVRGRLGRLALPVVGTFSALGATVLGAAVLLWIVGAAYGWQEAKVAALMATLLLVLAVAFILGTTRYAVTLDLARTRVAVGDNAVGSISVANASPRAILPAALELPVGQATALFHLPRMKPADVHEDLFTIPTARRAVITVGPVRSVRADPLRLLRRQLVWTDPTLLYVHPRTTALDGPAAGFLKDLEGLPTTELSSADVSFHALRDYVPGDDRRHIHWKTTARTGKLMVRQFEETRRAHLAVALSVNTEEYVHDDDLELAISAAASLGRAAIKEYRELSVVTQRGPIRCETGKNLLDDMTRLAGHARRGTAVDLARSLSDSVPNASVVFLVVGSKVTPAQLRSAAAAVPPGVRAFAIRCHAGAEPARAGIADLTVLTLGDLADLPVLLRKAIA
ncbi:hypothetical protein AL755_06540 [Arthrobacter sp. ERGS1:01]|uniref:DUF58 domain-containing protein n=1 Tax=Arthrobacter sp. ERGS1:01 TaxID=1704044 RepID=UPI0006B56A5C|nr:DUF58 domain-containing protein [Arthrobacter sp. ERGS1:01]ALE05215.1 hypothetical protein AL755_06540 [Arthrobacter sp. ERGS1:01]